MAIQIIFNTKNPDVKKIKKAILAVDKATGRKEQIEWAVRN